MVTTQPKYGYDKTIIYSGHNYMVNMVSTQTN